MYFSRIHFHPSADSDLAGRINGYHEHQALWDLFDPEPNAKRDFLFRRETAAGMPVFYLVSQRKPADRHGLWEVQTKDYRPKLSEGQSLGFSLRVNPVITRTDKDGRSVRNDLVMDLKKSVGWQDQKPSERESMDALEQRAGEQWLGVRLDRHGARLDNLKADGYRRHRSRKHGQKAMIRYSTLDLRGSLTVTDPERLRAALFHGIGPAKAFGCGLLLVRRLYPYSNG